MVFPAVLLKEAHKDVVVAKDCIPHPKSVGAYESLGAPQGEIASFRLALRDGKCIHIREFPEHYTVHWDKFDPGLDLPSHLLYDAPEWIPAIAMTIGGVGGYYGAKDSENRQANTFKGIGIGLIAGLIVAVLAEATNRN